MKKHPWQTVMESGDTSRLSELLAPDVTFHSPLVRQPFHGVKLVAALVPLLRRCFDNVVYTADLSGESMRALVASVQISGLDGQNMQLLRFDDSGLIDDITVMLRPFTLGTALSKLMAPQVDRLPDGSYTVKGLAG